MSIFKVAPDQIETFTIVANPKRTFVTSSAGATGSVYVMARRSSAEKDVYETGFDDSPFGDATLEGLARSIRNRITSSNDIRREVQTYIDAVHAREGSKRNTVSLPINRYTPTAQFSENTLRKNQVRNLLYPYYRVDYPTAHWAYTNYHCMSFFTASTMATGSVLLYPNVIDAPSGGAISGSYAMTGGFTFDFYVNPRYRTSRAGENFHASTLLHLSSSYAVSLVSGSEKDFNGRTKGYRILLQLSHSADITPSLATQGTYPNNLIFLSDDNSLQYNNWHHVVIRWGTSAVNAGTGSIMIDGVTRGVFAIPSSTLSPRSFEGSNRGNPDVLCVGNFYEGTNIGASQQSYFFSTYPAERDGIEQLVGDPSREAPQTYRFRHPFNAEFHDLVIKDGFTPDDIVVSGSGLGLDSLENVKFYLPPFFTPESPWRRFVGDHGGVLQTPFFAVDGTTDDPFNVAMAFGVGGHYINLENFTRDFATGRYPRLLMLSASELQSTTTSRTANEFLYDNEAVRRRNLLVLPCDDGLFIPNYTFLTTGSATKSVDDLGYTDYSWITLNNLIPTSSLYSFVTDESGSLFTKLAGPTPESPGVEPGEVLTIYQRLRDNSSNQVTFFNISNLYYGLRIQPGTFTVTDPSFTSSAGALSVTLADDGNGNLYRADCETSPATWNSVGNIFYNEGIIVVKSPHLNFFGKEGFEMEFKGEQTIHTLRVNVFAEANTLNSSSNPNYLPLSASLDANDLDQKFVYISDILYMDEAYNVVMKTSLAQPVKKRTGDRYMFKTKIDM